MISLFPYVCTVGGGSGNVGAGAGEEKERHEEEERPKVDLQAITENDELTRAKRGTIIAS